MDKNDQKWFLTKIKKAIKQYQMITSGDRIAVALSGGKDSMVLLLLLNHLRCRSHLNFQLCAIHIDCGWPAQSLTPMEQLCTQLSIPLYIEKSCIAQALFPNGRQIANPCGLCSRLRRGALVQWAAENQCHKIALGHHLDDFVETAFMNLLYGGQYQVFAPRIDYPDRNLSIIRPLVYIGEQTCRQLVTRYQLRPAADACPVHHQTQRQTVKELLYAVRLQYPDLNQKVLHSLEHGRAEQLWNFYHQQEKE